MTRDPNTPLVLWVCAAICAHYVFAEGGGRVAEVHDDRMFIAALGQRARAIVEGQERTFEVSSLGTEDKVAEPPPAPPPPKPEPKKPEEKKKAEAPKPPPKKPEEKKVRPLVVKKDPAHKPPEMAPLLDDKRIAVRQHVKPNQDDNPNAHFIGDEANKVDQETAATLTSHERDDQNPTPGTNHSGPQDKVGDSEQTKVAETEDTPGDREHAPGEKGTELDAQHNASPKDPALAMRAVPSPPQSGGDGHPSAAAQNAPPQEAPGGASGSPEVAESSSGGWTFNPLQTGSGSGPSSEAGEGPSQKAAASPGVTRWLGLGGRAAPGQVNLNLTHAAAIAIIGQDELRREREADGERRKSEHRGSWSASNFERWRSAIENYVSSVKPGNQTALNTARVPFATYLNGMHNRIHPLFADSFLSSLDSLPPNHPMNDQKLITRLEIVVSRDGHLVKMGVVKTSGITAFDIAALDAVNRAQPFGPAPGAIVSPDGNVYLHWEFHRDEVYACSTMNARPFLLNTPAKHQEETPTPPGPKSPSNERGAPPPINVNDVREGALPPRVDPTTT